MYPHNYIIPNNSNTMYRNSVSYSQDGERFFLAPFLVGGLAGTALGYGIANNNQMNNQCCGGGGFYPMPMPVYQVPYSQPIYSTQTPYSTQGTYSTQATSPNSFSNFGNNNNFY